MMLESFVGREALLGAVDEPAEAAASVDWLQSVKVPPLATAEDGALGAAFPVTVGAGDAEPGKRDSRPAILTFSAWRSD